MLDFAKNLFRMRKIGTIAWMLVNAYIITIVVAEMIIPMIITGLPLWGNYAIGAAVYFVCIVIALSPVGEVAMRFTQGVRKTKDPVVLNRLQTLWDEVYAKAKENSPSLKDDICFLHQGGSYAQCLCNGKKNNSGSFRIAAYERR